jgi:succinoglycan biosynthesis protein ExoA
VSVLVVIPCLNEEAHLPGLLGQLLTENPEATIVVADGGSNDGSRDIVRGLAAVHPRLQLLDNPRRIQSAGVNLAASRFGDRHRWLVRIDAHCDYPAGYVAGLVATAEAQGATSVVVPMRTAGKTWFQRAVAVAQNSVLGNGGSPHRNIGIGCWVDHGHHALFDLALYRSVGGYDEGFSHNEDAELDFRLLSAGGRIWLEPDLAVTYYPRRALRPLLRQYFAYGRGRAKFRRRHGAAMKARQMVPLAIAPAVGLAVLGLMLAAAHDGRWLILALPMLGWALACQAFAVLLAVRQNSRPALGAGIAAMAMHLGWSAGFLGEMLAGRAGR